MAQGRKKNWGIALIITGAVVLLAALCWFLKPLVLEFLAEPAPVEEEPVMAADTVQRMIPVPTGSSELKEFYENNPVQEVKNEVFKEEDEGYEYYTRPDGSAWKKDSTNSDIKGDSKKGTEDFDIPDFNNIHVEFWESSVGFRGYQMKGNNVYLYGINPQAHLRFENHLEGIWLRVSGDGQAGEQVYLLKPTDKDTPFESVKPQNE